MKARRWEGSNGFLIFLFTYTWAWLKCCTEPLARYVICWSIFVGKYTIASISQHSTARNGCRGGWWVQASQDSPNSVHLTRMYFAQLLKEPWTDRTREKIPWIIILFPKAANQDQIGRAHLCHSGHNFNWSLCLDERTVASRSTFKAQHNQITFKSRQITNFLVDNLLSAAGQCGHGPAWHNMHSHKKEIVHYNINSSLIKVITIISIAQRL